MKQAVKPKSIITHNIIWKKWQVRKKQYQQQRTNTNVIPKTTHQIYLKSTKIVTPHKLQNPDHMLSIQSSQQITSFTSLTTPHANSKYAINRKSYGQFLKDVNEAQSDISWLMVGQPRSYYVSHNRSVKCQQQIQKSLSRSRKKLSRSFHRPKTQPISTQTIGSTIQKLPCRKRINMTAGEGRNKTQCITQQIQKNKFSCRPWSIHSRSSAADLILNR